MYGRFAGPSKNGSSGHDEVSFQRPTNSIPAHSLLLLVPILDPRNTTPTLGAESQRPSFSHILAPHSFKQTLLHS
jgi:hypothetical protein